MGKGTISEKRTSNGSMGMGENPNQTATNTSGMGDSDIAEIIDASAGGLDSITNMVGMFTGKPAATETNYTAPPSEKKKVSPFVWIGGGVLVFLLIALLISSKNGQATSPQT
jgi:hypothetical protein